MIKIYIKVNGCMHVNMYINRRISYLCAEFLHMSKCHIQKHTVCMHTFVLVAEVTML